VIYDGLQPFSIGSFPDFLTFLCGKRTQELSISPNREALKNLAAFSIDEEFYQKFGGKVFGYAGVPASAYR
jgi:hypothetical protein